MRRDRVSAGTATLLVLLALASCTADPTTAARRLRVMTPVRPPAGYSEDAVTTERLDDALLRADDLPAGFERQPLPDEEPDRADPVSCGSILDDLQTDQNDDPGVLAASASLASADQSDWIQEMVRYFAGGSPRSHLAAAATALAGCPEVLLHHRDGTLTTELISVHSVAPTTVVARIVATTGALQVSENLAVQVVGDVLLVITHTAPGPPDYATTADLLSRAARRLVGVTG
jgi:hypothetical protein